MGRLKLAATLSLPLAVFSIGGDVYGQASDECRSMSRHAVRSQIEQFTAALNGNDKRNALIRLAEAAAKAGNKARAKEIFSNAADVPSKAITIDDQESEAFFGALLRAEAEGRAGFKADALGHFLAIAEKVRSWTSSGHQTVDERRSYFLSLIAKSMADTDFNDQADVLFSEAIDLAKHLNETDSEYESVEKARVNLLLHIADQLFGAKRFSAARAIIESARTEAWRIPSRDPSDPSDRLGELKSVAEAMAKAGSIADALQLARMVFAPETRARMIVSIAGRATEANGEYSGTALAEEAFRIGSHATPLSSFSVKWLVEEMADAGFPDQALRLWTIAFDTKGGSVSNEKTSLLPAIAGSYAKSHTEYRVEELLALLPEGHSERREVMWSAATGFMRGGDTEVGLRWKARAVNLGALENVSSLDAELSKASRDASDSGGFDKALLLANDISAVRTKNESLMHIYRKMHEAGVLAHAKDQYCELAQSADKPTAIEALIELYSLAEEK